LNVGFRMGLFGFLFGSDDLGKKGGSWEAVEDC
jgi:hypothetical protein